MQEIQLNGGRSTETVIRIENTVRRSINKNSSFIHLLLKHLEQENFPYAPRFLGLDEQGREILSFIEGKTLQGISFTDEQLIACTKILKELHDKAALSNLCGKEETICHNDFAPWNVIFLDNIPVGIIDFDDSKPGNRIDDFAYFLWTFLELGNREFDAKIQIQRIKLLCKVYSFKDEVSLKEAILRQQQRILQFRKERAFNKELEKEKRTFSAKKIVEIKNQINWVKQYL